MNNAEFQLRGSHDPRLAVHAASPLPALLWSIDGTRILWANPVGAKLFGAANAAALAAKTFGPADPHRRQVAQLAGRLLPTGATRLERLRGFGAALGTLVTCACARLDFPDGGAGILVVAMLSPGELQRIDAAGADRARAPVESACLCNVGRVVDAPDSRPAVEATGHLVVEPLPESPVHAEIEPTHQPDVAAMDRRTPDYEQAATTGEAPAEFALIDEIAEPAAEPAVEHVAADETASTDLSRPRRGTVALCRSRRRRAVATIETEPPPAIEAVARG